MQVSDSSPSDKAVPWGTRRWSFVTVLLTVWLAACSSETRGRMWQAIDPLGYSREHDVPFLYRDTKPTNKSYLMDSDDAAIGRSYRSYTP